MKKRKFFVLALSALMAACVVGLAACDNDAEGSDDDPSIVTPGDDVPGTPDDGNQEQHEHTYGEWVIEQEATCTNVGTRVRTCLTCMDEQTETIPALGHDIVEHAGQAATCTQPGWEAYETCSRCNYTTYAALSALGHDTVYHAGQAATCTQAGWEAYETCSRCDYTTYTAIPEAGHRFVPHAGQDPTCTQSGWAAYETCENCDYTTYQALSSLGHHYVNGACDRCGASDPSVPPEPDEQLVYRFNGSGYTVTGIGTMSDAVLTIPSTYNGHPVTEIGGSAFEWITWLSDVTIPEGVTNIGGGAFNGCTGLKSIDIPEGVTSIGGFAFYGCTGLTSIDIPDSVTEIGAGAFLSCTGLTKVVIPDGVTEIGSNMFAGCTGLESIVIPDSVTVIDGFAFDGCTALKSVVFENPEGWVAEGNEVSSEDLSDPAVAASLLAGEHAYYGKWERYEW
ncbi:MAG TPA: leucine-rich repeat domain-containing protein [Candidatus Gallimonas intestinigallinarum]|uniref:Leucine-rich repeat domain-containing protein n=1 Tax=Candidatus Gallimonas intestinigallinarum TaxID=2838604 RepID=A0A9D2DX59_9FIRM|nr:leucine-rich repeat domain-containing protein [Candidatus Gallimonas intestinigallinarum]